jgi:hypothetical protein
MADTESAPEVEDEESRVEHSKEIKEIVVYIFFMIFFTLSTTKGLTDGDFYYFGANLKEQLTGVEMRQEHSPVFDKTFTDVATVEEWYHWMQGALLHTVFTPNTFDADQGFAFQNGNSRRGYTLGHGKFLGPIRISQLRSQAFNCDDRVYSVLSERISVLPDISNLYHFKLQLPTSVFVASVAEITLHLDGSPKQQSCEMTSLT